MKSVDALFGKKYEPEKYHCVHFVIDAAQYLLDENYTKNFVGLTSSLHETLKASRHTAIKNRLRNKDEKPKQGDIVLMTNVNQSSHVGLFYCGQVLHLTELGVHFLPIQTIHSIYKRIRIYEPYQSISKSD